MLTKVQKFGGSSLANLDRVRLVARHVAESKAQCDKLVVVVSAMGQQTDRLLGMAHRLSAKPSQRELDVLLSAGERMSMALLSIALNDLGLATVSFTGSQSGIITDPYHGNARIKAVLGDRILDALDHNKIAIVAGFQGMNLDSKDITTLGRGGSDLTAIALAHRIKAERCELYKDVDAVFSADPKVVTDAKPVKNMSWNTLSQLSWHGAGVVHARAVHLAQKTELPLEIRSSFNLNTQGTLIGKEMGMESAQVVALTKTSDLNWIEISGSSIPVLGKLSEWLWSHGAHPIISCEKFVPKKGYCCELFVPSLLVDSLKELDFIRTARLQNLAREMELASLSLIGNGFWQEPEILSQSIHAIEGPIFWKECKNHAITFIVEQKQLETHMLKLHQLFFP